MARVGIGSYIGFGGTSTYATNITNANIRKSYRVGPGFDGLQLEKDSIIYESLSDWDVSLTEAEEGQARVTGSVTFTPTYGGFQDVLRWLTGHGASSSGSTDPYTWAFTPIDYGATGHYWSSGDQSFGMEVYRNQGTNSVYYQGLVFPEATFNFEPNSPVECVLGVLGRTGTISAKKATPAFDTDPMFTSSGQGSSPSFLLLDGTAYTVRSASVSINNGFEPNYGVTDLETNLPQPSGKREVRLEAEVETDDDTLLTDLLDWKGSVFGAASANEVTLENAAGDHSLKFAFPRLILEAPAETSVDTHGVLTAKLSFRAVKAVAGDATPAYTVTLVNADADYPSA